MVAPVSIGIADVAHAGDTSAVSEWVRNASASY
jgi:hypothetical protein